MQLVTRELTVRFGGVTAVDRLSLAIDGGRLTGIIGPNGAGKTTFIDAVSGLVRSTGAIELDGRSITNWPPHRRAQAGIGRTFQGVELFDEFTIQENLLIPAEALAPLVVRARPDPAAPRQPVAGACGRGARARRG